MQSRTCLVESSHLLGAIPSAIRQQLLDEFNKLINEYREARWESSEMSGGKLCEIVYTILKGHLDGAVPDRHEHGPRNMLEALNALEAYPSSMGRSARIQIPRIIAGVYELRNNRGVGHAGGDVKPNHMDATYIVSAAKWIISELIRLFHDIDPREAAASVELLTDREMPIVWSIGTQRRVLSGALNKTEETLLLLYSVESAKATDLFKWVEYSNLSVYKSKILNPGHKLRYWEYDKSSGELTLSAVGSAQAETILRRESTF